MIGLKSALVIAAIIAAAVSAILVGSDTLAHAIYVADLAIVALAISHFAKD